MSVPHNKLNPLLRVGVAALSLACCAATHAEYRLAAFDEARAAGALIRLDTETAAKRFSSRSSLPLDYADLNNLCVLRMLEGNNTDAESVCKKAYSKVSEKSMRLRSKRRARAVILANLSVAQLRSGKVADAEASVAKAEALDDRNPNVSEIRAVIARRQLAANG